MNKEDIDMIGFEIVAYAGEARSKLLEALNKAEKKEFDKIDSLIEEADQSIKKAHNAQSELLAKDAGGEDVMASMIMVHGQDHLMTTMLLKDLINHLVELYKRG